MQIRVHGSFVLEMVGAVPICPSVLFPHFSGNYFWQGKKMSKQSNKLDWQARFRLEFRKTAQSIKARLICIEQ